MSNVLVSWSGGKDSCYAAMLAQQQGFTIKGFLNILNAEGETSRAHGIPAAILKAQAEAADLPLLTVAASWQQYEQKFTEALVKAKSNWNIMQVVFGDIDLEDHRAWEEKVCSAIGLGMVLPLWKKARKALVLQMIDEGMEMTIVSCNTTMGPTFLGRTLNHQLVAELESLGIDPCGEEGEFHTVVTACKMFQKPFKVAVTNPYRSDNYWYAKIERV